PAVRKLPSACLSSLGDRRMCSGSTAGCTSGLGKYFQEIRLCTGCPHSGASYPRIGPGFPRPHPPNRPQPGDSPMPIIGYVPGLEGHVTDVPKIVVRLTADEILVLCNCINETLDSLGSLDDAELADRV